VGDLSRPVHLLAALSELDGPISDALRPPAGGPLFPRPGDPSAVNGGGAGYLAMQTQQAASQLATQLGQPERPEHLLLAVIDQAEPEAVAVISRSGLDLGAVRRAALDLLGAPADLPVITMPPLTAAGTMDRPALTVEQLDADAWRVLCWRQEHLPLTRVRRKGDWQALSSLESRAAWRVADRFHLNDDQRYSMMAHHDQTVERLAHAANPAVVETRQQLMERHGGGHDLTFVKRRWNHRWRRVVPNFVVGWPTWFANRRVGIRNRRFWLITRSAYRGQPGQSDI
jgi:hypothetical protein